ncbi:response regulator [Sulfitobacter sp. PS-8MA]|uniref:response regulator n=1 Tax=Sulfitobacter sp. PS-8MA TaxID=3237707 RepID=UPI0034C6B3C8
MTSRILHIDDDPIVLELVKSVFSGDRDIAVLSCLNAHDALEVVKDLRPDLILSDISMPEMGGLELAHNLKQIDAISDVPIIFLSGRSRDLEVYDSFRKLAAIVLQKPVDPSDLRAKVRQLLDEAAQPGAAPDQA